MAILLKPNDAAWLAMDRPEHPCHVACLSIFKPPAEAPSDYLRQLVERFGNTRNYAPPFNYVRKGGLVGTLPAWEPIDAEHIDLDYHFRHSALPAPGGQRELGVLISRLHSQPLDFKRPLWEMHVIEGLADGRFAIYLKLHHSQFDGMAGIALWRRAMTTDPTLRDCPPPWTVGMASGRSEAPQQDSPRADAAGSQLPGSRAIKGLGASVRSLGPAIRAIGELGAASITADQKSLRGLPFRAPKTILNGKIDSHRRIATQSFEMDRIRAVSKKAEVSINDVFVAVCGAALRRYLVEQGQLPSEPMVAGLPVSVRPQGDSSVGNAIAFMHAYLGTHVADPVERLRACHESATKAKAHLQKMPKASLIKYTMLLMAPHMGPAVLGLGDVGRPMHNLIISNVPGSAEPQYLDGALMEECYPISLIYHGQALNISVFSGAGRFNLGFVGCRRSVPHMQQLAVFAAEALAELEQALGLTGNSAAAAAEPHPAQAGDPAEERHDDDSAHR